MQRRREYSSNLVNLPYENVTKIAQGSRINNLKIINDPAGILIKGGVSSLVNGHSAYTEG